MYIHVNYQLKYWLLLKTHRKYHNYSELFQSLQVLKTFYLELFCVVCLKDQVCKTYCCCALHVHVCVIHAITTNYQLVVNTLLVF